MLIPKVIHYCWFGGKKKSRLIEDCIKSWRVHLSDYNIIEWNEQNSDLTNAFVQEAYKLKKWAFVSDYIRLKILYENGGIYLDTDMMVVKSFDSLLFSQCFFGAEDSEFISCGIIGTLSKNSFIKQCLLKYESINFQHEIDWKNISIPKIITEKFRENNTFFLQFDKMIQIDQITIYPINYFYPLSYQNKGDIKNYKNYITVDTFAVHLWNGSWIEYSEFHYLRKGEYVKGLQVCFKNFSLSNIKVSYLRKLASCVKESFHN